MSHSKHDIHAAMQHVASHSDHNAKKAALFDTIHGMIVKGVADSKALGATDAMLKPFTDTMQHFVDDRAAIIAIDLT